MLEPIIYERPGHIMRMTEERKAINLYIDSMFLRDYACLFGTRENIPDNELTEDYQILLELAVQATMTEKLERLGADVEFNKGVVKRVTEDLDYALTGKDVLTMTRGQEYVVAPPPLHDELHVRETFDSTAYKWGHFLFSCIDCSHVVKQFVVMYDDSLALGAKFVLPARNPEKEDDFLPRLFDSPFSMHNTPIGDAFLTRLHAAVQTIKHDEPGNYKNTIDFGFKRKQLMFDAYWRLIEDIAVQHGLLVTEE